MGEGSDLVTNPPIVVRQVMQMKLIIKGILSSKSVKSTTSHIKEISCACSFCDKLNTRIVLEFWKDRLVLCLLPIQHCDTVTGTSPISQLPYTLIQLFGTKFSPLSVHCVKPYFQRM